MSNHLRVLVPLPDRGFDTTEVAVPWRLLTDAGYDVVFATEGGGTAPCCDPRLLSGVIFGKLGAEADARRFYSELELAPAFRNPIPWHRIQPGAYAGLILPGGHAPGMRQYLGSDLLQRRLADYWQTGKPVGAICHGVLLLARARDPGTGKSLIAGRRTTCLPKYMERIAYYLTAWRLGRYYRTYPSYVEDEVKAALDDPRAQFERGPLTFSRRGHKDDVSPAFAVQDGCYVSARWPGDAYLFAQQFIALLGLLPGGAVVGDGLG